TWSNGSTGIAGTVSFANSLVGNPGDLVGSSGVIALSNGNYLVGSAYWNVNRGAVTWVSGTSGQTLDGKGVITPQNSLVGVGYPIIENPIRQSFLALGGGRLTVGLTDPNQFSYARGQAQ